jgi:hypothetical protein
VGTQSSAPGVPVPQQSVEAVQAWPSTLHDRAGAAPGRHTWPWQVAPAQQSPSAAHAPLMPLHAPAGPAQVTWQKLSEPQVRPGPQAAPLLWQTSPSWSAWEHRFWKQARPVQQVSERQRAPAASQLWPVEPELPLVLAPVVPDELEDDALEDDEAVPEDVLPVVAPVLLTVDVVPPLVLVLLLLPEQPVAASPASSARARKFLFMD